VPGIPPPAPPGGGEAPPAAREGAVLPVSLLVSSARLLLERHLGLVWVGGEISNFTRAASGHCYFNLKDEQAQVRCVFFRHKAQFVAFALRDGLAVEVRATPSIYEARGEFQLNVETVRLAGVGALYERYERLKARLDAAGWFAEARKRTLPPFPRAVGIVTSTRAAALSDILTTLRRRWPALPVVVYPTAVQGDGAAGDIAQAIRAANARAEVDVLIVGRGGGSIEDLWAFNEEVVAAAVYESAIPVVSAVGHETDFTICDFVADVRAPTPTAAATLVAPDRLAVGRHVDAIALRWRRGGERLLEARMQRLDGLGRRLVHPAARLAQQTRDAQALAGRLVRAFRHRLVVSAAGVAVAGRRLARQLGQPRPEATRVGALGDRWRRAADTRLERTATRLAALERSLAHLNPQGVLERGYAIVARGDGAIVHDAAEVAPGDDVALTFARGTAGARITRRD
jgi:exodeoxyribonuclease VII large subunit